MGLFSTKKKTVVNADLIPLVDPKDRDTYAMRGLYRYIFDRDKTMRLHERIMEEFNGILPIRFEAAYRYASRRGYAIGLPRASENMENVDRVQVVKEHLKRMYGLAVDDIHVDYVIASEPHLQHYAWVKLQEQYGYNLNTNELEFLSTEKGFPVYLESFQVNVGTITQSEVIKQEYLAPQGLSPEWGKTATRSADTSRANLPFVLSTTDPLDFTNVQYSWVEVSTTTEIQQVPKTVIVIDPETQEEVEQVVMEDVEVQVEVHTPYTDSLVLTYEDVIPPPAEDGMPLDIEADEVQVMYTYLGVRYTHEYVMHSNEDSVFEQAMLGELINADYYPGFYARINKENLYERDKEDPYYKALRGLGKRLQLDWVDWSKNLVNSMENPNDIRDALITTMVPLDSDEAVAAKYGFKYFEEMIAAATHIGNVPRYSGTDPYIGVPQLYSGTKLSVGDNIFTYTFSCKYLVTAKRSGVMGKVGEYVAAFDPFDDIASWFSLEGRYSAYYFQDTETTYIEYRVYSAVTNYTINSRQATEQVIPLKRSIVRANFNNLDKERLFQVSTYIYVGTSVVVKTKWYARGAFKAVMFVVAVVVSVFTGGAGLAAFASWQAAITAVAVAAVQTIAVSLVINLLGRILVASGLDASIIQVVAVVLIVAAVYVGAGGSIGELTATDLLAFSNEALRISNVMTEIQLAQIQSKLVDITEEFKQKMEEISDLQDSVGLLSPEMLLEISNVFYESRLGESAEQFHNRMNGAPVTELVEAQVSEYVQIMTTLPDFQAILQMFRRDS